MKQLSLSQAAEALQRMYDSAINFQIGTRGDTGFNYKIGDRQNGYSIESREHDNIVDAVTSRADQVAQKNPESDFAKWYQRLAA